MNNEDLLKRIELLEGAVLPALAMLFPSLFPFVPAVTALTGAADKVVEAIDGVDTHAAAVAKVAAIVAPSIGADNGKA
jgi:hypothetical protein